MLPTSSNTICNGVIDTSLNPNPDHNRSSINLVVVHVLRRIIKINSKIKMPQAPQLSLRIRMKTEINPTMIISSPQQPRLQPFPVSVLTRPPIRGAIPGGPSGATSRWSRCCSVRRRDLDKVESLHHVQYPLYALHHHQKQQHSKPMTFATQNQ